MFRKEPASRTGNDIPYVPGRRDEENISKVVRIEEERSEESGLRGVEIW
jgi:hypothetical protein